MIHTIDETTYESYLAALLAGNRAECAVIVEKLVFAGTSLKDLYTDLFQRSLYQVGELWEKQRISVAVEHLCTAITERMLTLVQGQVFSGPARDQSVVIACVADEYHQLGARMVADFCEMHGWRGYFLGANTSLERLQRVIDERRPDSVGLSLAIYFNLPALLKALDAISRDHPDLPILVGGQAFRWGAETAVRAYPKVSYMASLNQLEQWMAAYEP